jgi:2-amino-4-hydroxy-6-hydroxymethyldihydropteridine diphosphokinase
MIDNWSFLGLGSNVGERRLRLQEGIRSLEHAGFDIKRRSSFYETEPVGYDDQPWFLNAVVGGETALNPKCLLKRCQKIEKEAGRKRTARFGPRSLDIDILLYKGRVIDEQYLVIPHPRMHERRFVLVPLVEIAPEIEDPRTGKRFAEILAELDDRKKVTKSKANGF